MPDFTRVGHEAALDGASLALRVGCSAIAVQIALPAEYGGRIA